MPRSSIGTWADIDGAKPLGIRVAWINRGNERLGDWQARPDHEVLLFDAATGALRAALAGHYVAADIAEAGGYATCTVVVFDENGLGIG